MVNEKYEINRWNSSHDFYQYSLGIANGYSFNLSNASIYTGMGLGYLLLQQIYPNMTSTQNGVRIPFFFGLNIFIKDDLCINIEWKYTFQNYADQENNFTTIGVGILGKIR